MPGYSSSRAPWVLDPGELRHSVTIEQPSTAGDAFGQSVSPTAWVTVRATQAAIFTAGGKETSDVAQLVSDVSHVVKVRWTSTVLKAGYRLLFGNRYFTISYVENVMERDRVLLLYCREVDGGAQ